MDKCVYEPLLPGADQGVVVTSVLGSLVLVDVVITVGVAVGVEFNLGALTTCESNLSVD